jgi:hypothetical protein
MSSSIEFRFTLPGLECHFQIRWPRAAKIAIQKYEVAPAPFLPEIRRTLLRRLKSRVCSEDPAAKRVSHSCSLRPQSLHRRETWNLRGL